MPNPPTDKISQFKELLLKWNQKINLISKSSITQIDTVHIGDAVKGAEIIIKEGSFQEIYDLGSGNGIPGVVLACLMDKTAIICVESDQRKAAFLSTVAVSLGLKNLFVKNIRIEDINERKQRVYCARGLSSIKESLKLVESSSLPGSIFYHFKSSKWKEEMDLQCSTWNTQEIGEYALGDDAIPRVIVKSVML